MRGKSFIAALLSMAMFMATLAVPQAAAVPNGAITFDSSSDMAYTVQSGASLLNGRSGKALNSVNASNSYATIDNISAINSISGDFTLSIWCYPKDDAAWSRLYDVGTGTDKYIFLAPSSSYAKGYPRFAIKNSGSEQILASDKALTLNEWNHICVVRKEGVTSMYVNGIISGTTANITINPSDLGATTQNYLAKSQYSSDPYFNGMIDDFFVYDKALSYEEIRTQAAEAYTRELPSLKAELSKTDKYSINTQFYNSAGEKIFQISEGQQITAAAYVKNNTTADGAVSAKLYSYDGTEKTELAASDSTQILISEQKSIKLSATVPAGCKYLNLVVTDSSNGQNFDAGYIGVSSVSFPSPAPADSSATTYGAHDPTIFKDPVGGKYWAYSSHNVIFESADLINWTKHDYTSTITVPASASTFISNNYSSTTANTTYWAPDILYVAGSDYPYWLYVSVSCGLGGRNSVISLLKCKSPGIFDGEYIDAGVVLASKEATGYKTNAIDSNIYTDTDGKRYFVWGSFWEGVQVAPLNDDGTIKGIDYTSASTILSSSMNFGNALFSVPSGVFGPEGPWMISNTETGYRYLFTSYGWLGTNYNIRVARSSLNTSMDSTISAKTTATQFTDQNGNPVGTAYSGQTDKTKLWGYKMFGSYQLGDGIVYYGNGHNSVLHDNDGNWYMVEHARKVADSVAYLQVHKMLWTAGGWPVVSPLTYSGEQVQKIDKMMLYGTWDLSSVGHTILASGVTNVSTCTSSDADLPVLSSEVTLQPDGNLGEGLGTWQFDNDHTVTITFAKDGDESKYQFYKAGDVLTLYVLTGYDKDKSESAIVMTGTDQNLTTQIAKKSNASVADTTPLALQTQSVILDKSAGNPVLGFDASGNTLYAGDPAATVIGDTVYLYAGHDTSTNDSYTMPEWVLYTSKDMKNWEYKGVVMSASSISWASNQTSAWASQMAEHNGKYYLYFCTWDKTDDGRQSIGVAVADSPEGPFVDKGAPLVKGSITTPQTSNWNDIDPTVWIETDSGGTEHRYLAWGNGRYYVCELNDDMISIKDKNGDGAIDMNDIKQQKFINFGSDSFTEAPWLYKRGSKYYTFFAANWRETIAYATSYSIFGPWTYCGQIMPQTATSNTNHPSVIDFGGKTYLIYHNGALSGGSGYRRSICVQELKFNDFGYVLPTDETSTGLSGTSTSIVSLSGKYVGHEEFKNPSDDASYPLSKTLVAFDAENGLNTAWEITKARYQPQNSEYVSIQSVNKPGLYMTESDGSVVLTQDTDGSLTDNMTFKTVAGLNGAGVSFESISAPGKYLTVMDNYVVLTYGRDKNACSFSIGASSPTPVPTAVPLPTATPKATPEPDIQNNFDSLATGNLLVFSTSDQTYTGIDGLTMYIGSRSSDTTTSPSSISIAAVGTTGNALVMTSGKYSSASRGPRIAIKTPTISTNGSATAKFNVKLVDGTSAGTAVLRYNDSTSSETGTTISGLSTTAWSELKINITDTNGTAVRTISVNGNVIATDNVRTFPVLWGTTSNSVNAKVYLDDFSITNFSEDAWFVISAVDGNNLIINGSGSSSVVYAAKYASDGSLEALEAYTAGEGTTTLSAGFEPDRVFVWSNKLAPYDKWAKSK